MYYFGAQMGKSASLMGLEALCHDRILMNFLYVKLYGSFFEEYKGNLFELKVKEEN